MRDQPWYHHVSIEAQRRGLWSNLAVCTRLVQATAFTFRSISPTDHFGVLELPDVRSGGSVSATRVGGFGRRGVSLPVVASLRRGQLCAGSDLCKVFGSDGMASTPCRGRKGKSCPSPHVQPPNTSRCRLTGQSTISLRLRQRLL